MALEYEIAQLGQRMGISGLTFSPEGLLAFEVQGIGRMYFEQRPAELLVYLARPIPLNGGVHKDQIILLTRLPERAVTAAALENSVSYLARQMDSITGNRY